MEMKTRGCFCLFKVWDKEIFLTGVDSCLLKFDSDPRRQGWDPFLLNRVGPGPWNKTKIKNFLENYLLSLCLNFNRFSLVNKNLSNNHIKHKFLPYCYSCRRNFRTAPKFMWGVCPWLGRVSYWGGKLGHRTEMQQIEATATAQLILLQVLL